MAKTAEQRDHVDRFIESIRSELPPDIDLTVEGTVSPYRGSPGKLAEHLELSSGAMTNRLDRLEEDGLIRRLPDPSDRRGVQVELTEAGQKAYKESTVTQASKEALIASALNRREQEQLNGLLRRLMIAFENLEAER